MAIRFERLPSRAKLRPERKIFDDACVSALFVSLPEPTSYPFESDAVWYTEAQSQNRGFESPAREGKSDRQGLSPSPQVAVAVTHNKCRHVCCGGSSKPVKFVPRPHPSFDRRERSGAWSLSS